MITFSRGEILKIMHAIEDQIIEYDREAVRSSAEYAEKLRERSHDLWRIKMRLRDVLDYDAKRIAVE